MKNILYTIILILLLSPQNMLAQTINKIITDEKSGKLILIDEINTDILQNDTLFSWWYNPGYNNYDVKSDLLKNLDFKYISIVVVLGTWCGDSRRELPHFIKILDKIGFNKANLKLIAVDRKKEGANVDVSDYFIERVPTFIVFNKCKEIGRITESPVKTLEEDLADIIRY